jgi:hypothetical protein
MIGVKEFEKGKRYVFSKEAYKKSNSHLMRHNDVEIFDGVEVRVTSDGIAVLAGNYVLTSWCVEKSDYEMLINYMVELVQSYKHKVEKLKDDYNRQMGRNEWDNAKQLLDKIHLYTILGNEIQDILNKEVNE